MALRGITDEHQLAHEVANWAGEPVELAIAARADRLPVVRALVETVLYVDDWSLDDVADMKLGIDEMCSQIIAAAPERGRVYLTLTSAPHGLAGVVRGTIEPGIEVDRSGFGWKVVQTVTDAQSISYDGGEANRSITVRFIKKRD